MEIPFCNPFRLIRNQGCLHIHFAVSSIYIHQNGADIVIHILHPDILQLSYRFPMQLLCIVSRYAFTGKASVAVKANALFKLLLILGALR